MKKTILQPLVYVCMYLFNNYLCMCTASKCFLLHVFEFMGTCNYVFCFFLLSCMHVCMCVASGIDTLPIGRPMCRSISVKIRTEMSPSNTRSRSHTELQKPADSREKEVRWSPVCMYVYMHVCMYVCSAYISCSRDKHADFVVLYSIMYVYVCIYLYLFVCMHV